MGGQPAAPAELSRRPWLRFATDGGRVSGNAGCNRFFGPFTIDGQSLRFGPLASTRMACAENQLSQQETSFLSALHSADRFEISADTLTVLRGADRLARLVR